MHFLGKLLDSRWTCYALGGVIGFLLGLVVSVTGSVSVAPSMTLDGIVQVLATVLVGWIIAILIQRASQKDDRQRTFLMGQLSTLLEHATRLEDFKDGKEYSQVTATLKRIRRTANVIANIVKSLDRSEFQLGQFNFKDDIDELRTLATDIDKITDGVKRANCSSEVKDGVIKLAAEREQRLQTKLDGFRSRIIEAQARVITG